MPKPGTCSSCWFCLGMCDDSSGGDHCADAQVVDCANPNQTDAAPGSLDGTCTRHVPAADVSFQQLRGVASEAARRHYVRMRVALAVRDLQLPPVQYIEVCDGGTDTLMALASEFGARVSHKESKLAEIDPLRDVLRSFRDMSAALDEHNIERGCTRDGKPCCLPVATAESATTVPTCPEMDIETLRDFMHRGYEVYAHLRVSPSGDPDRVVLNNINAWIRDHWLS